MPTRLFCVLLVMSVLLMGCSGKEETPGSKEVISREIFAMDTYMSISAYGDEAEAALEEAEAEIMRLDKLLAAEKEDSEIWALNENGGGSVSDDTAFLVEKAKELNKQTDGAFEIAIYPIKQLWGFSDQNYRVPGQDEIDVLLPITDSDLVVLEADGEGAKLAFAEDGVKIDLGGIAKGYASSRVAEIYKEHGVNGLINLGGNVQAQGAKSDGSAWRIAIRKPESAEDGAITWVDEDSKGGKALKLVEYIGVVETKDQAVVTSGGYERYFEEDGKIYHHIIDPETGYPSDSDLVSATVISRDGTLADGLSTSVFIMGLEKSTQFWRDHKNDGEFEMVLMDRQGNLYATEGLKDAFSSNLDINWIE